MAQKTLLEHAAYELTKAGLTNHEDNDARKVASDVMALIRRFVKQDHTVSTAPYTLEYFETLANFLPLTPITNDPSEWDKFEIDRKNVETDEVETTVVWQSRRMPSLISEDEGKTGRDQRSGQIIEIQDHKELEAKKEQDAKDRAARKAAAEDRAKSAGPVESDASPEAMPVSEVEAPDAQPKEELAPKGTATRVAQDAKKAKK